MDDTGETRDDLKPSDPDLEKEIRDKVENGEDALVCVLAVSSKLILIFQKFNFNSNRLLVKR